MSVEERVGKLEDHVRELESSVVKLRTERSTAAKIGAAILALIGVMLTGLVMLRG